MEFDSTNIVYLVLLLARISLILTIIYIIFIVNLVFYKVPTIIRLSEKILTTRFFSNIIIFSLIISRNILALNNLLFRRFVFITTTLFFSANLLRVLLSFGYEPKLKYFTYLLILILILGCVNSGLRIFFRIGFLLEKYIVLINPELFERIFKNSFTVLKQTFRNTTPTPPGQGLTRIETYTRAGVVVGFISVPILSYGLYETPLNRLASERSADAAEKSADAAMKSADAAMKSADAAMLEAETNAARLTFKMKQWEQNFSLKDKE